MSRNWADLQPELLGICSQHLCPKDLPAFRAVCRSWRSAAVCRSRRSAAVKERNDGPWLMLADKKGNAKQKRWREFFCLLCQRVHTKLLPEANTRRCFSSRGWVLTIGRDWELHMLKNPMSPHGHIIKLPNINKFPLEKNVRSICYYVYAQFIGKFVLSDCPITSPDYRVMVIYNIGRLGIWKPGDMEWTEVECPLCYTFDVIFHKGCFFALDCLGNILKCDVDGPTPYQAQVVFNVPDGLLHCESAYLVQSTTGSLLMVSRHVRQKTRATVLFNVFEIDLETQSWKGVKTLKNMSLFLGWNSSFSLEVDEKHHIKPNCIYFTDDFIDYSLGTKDGLGKDMGIYHLEDRTIERHFRGKSCSHFSPPLWIEPNF